MSLRELYQEVIIDHNNDPRNHYIMDSPTSSSRGFNPLCGDKLEIFLKIADNIIIDISFKGSGCAISQASGSLMTEIIKGKTITKAKEIFASFHNMLTKDSTNCLDKLTVLAGVKNYPARVKCATLAWHTFDAALQKDTALVSTE